jgi:predicted DNA-binding protein
MGIEMRERIDKLCKERSKEQAKVIREAIDIGLTELEARL